MSVLTRRSSFVLACVAGLAPALAHAQQPGPGAPLPIAVDLAKAPIGSRAEYTATMGSLPPMTIQLSLVGRAGRSVTIEMSAEGGMAAMAGGKVVMSSVVETDRAGNPDVKKLVMQVGPRDPMEMPAEMSHANKFKKLDSKTLVGTETLKVKAGSFKTKHYRDKAPSGDVVDYWVSPSAPPIGLVKMQAETKNAAAAAGAGAMAIGSITMELAALSKDAKPTITKAARPFDIEKLKQEMMPGGGAAPPGATK